MKLLKRNCTEFKYFGYTGLNSDVDEDTGLHTGIWKPIYAEPVSYRGNISSPDGDVTQAFDGLEIRYTHVLLLDDPDADIHETGYIEWKGHKYDIAAAIPSMNVLSVALKQRSEDHGDQHVEPDGEDE